MSRASTLLRVTLFWVAYFVILLLAAIPRGMVPPAWGSLVWGLVASPLIILLARFCIARTTPPLDQVGLRPTLGSLGRGLAGLVIGAATYALALAAISRFVAPLHYTRVAPPSSGQLLLILATTGALAVMEELGFRGYPLRALLQVLPAWQAQLLVAFAFAASHLAFGWPWQTALLGVLPSALLFGAVAQWSGGLAMPIGVHVAVNLARVATGERGGEALWRLAVDDASAAPLATWAPIVAAGMTLLAAALVWAWSLRPRPRGAYLSGSPPES